MNNPTHHPSIELLATFSGAGLPLNQGLCISTHLEHCPECRQSLQQLDRLGGELLQRLKPASTSSTLRESVFKKINQKADHGRSHLNDTVNQQPLTPSVTARSIPRCLKPFVPYSYDSLSWKRVSSAISSSELCRDNNGVKVELLRIKAGGRAATHTHLGEEFTVVLEGSFFDESGLYQAGDFMLKDPSHTHTPVATLDGECICLIVTEAPVQLTGFLYRMLNPFLRSSHSA